MSEWMNEWKVDGKPFFDGLDTFIRTKILDTIPEMMVTENHKWQIF